MTSAAAGCRLGPRARLVSQAPLGAVASAASRSPAGGSGRARHVRRDEGEELHATHKRKPTARKVESVGMARLPLSREQGGHRPTAGSQKWSVLLASGSGKYLQVLGSVCEWAPAVTGLANFLCLGFH